MEAQSSDIAGTVQHAYNDGFGRGYAEVDVVVAVHDEAEAGADVIAGDAAVAEPGDLFHMGNKLKNETIGGPRIVPSDARANGSQSSAWRVP